MSPAEAAGALTLLLGSIYALGRAWRFAKELMSGG